MRLCILFAALIFSVHARSAVEVEFSNVWQAPNYTSSNKALDLSVHVATQSQWSTDKIKKRLLRADKILQTCGVSIRNVFFYNLKLSQQLVRADDIEERTVYYDGMRFIAQKSKSVTAVQLFYFQDYLEPFTPNGAVPLAVFGEDFPLKLQNTAWFPYNSIQRRKKGTDPALTYSEEAHELGHILMRTKHIHTDAHNIMSNSSSLRSINHFYKNQCLRLKIPTQDLTPFAFSNSASTVFPFFKNFFHSYSKNTYMVDHCSRNSWNFIKSIRSAGGLELTKTAVVYVTGKRLEAQTMPLHPLTSRHPVKRWTFHAFSLIDGVVYDFDYGREARPIALRPYLISMFGEAAKEQLYQVHTDQKVTDHSRHQVYETFKGQPENTLTFDELIRNFSDELCNKL